MQVGFVHDVGSGVGCLVCSPGVERRRPCRFFTEMEWALDSGEQASGCRCRQGEPIKKGHFGGIHKGFGGFHIRAGRSGPDPAGAGLQGAVPILLRDRTALRFMIASPHDPRVVVWLRQPLADRPNAVDGEDPPQAISLGLRKVPATRRVPVPRH